MRDILVANAELVSAPAARSPAIDYLRAITTVIVLIFHSLLAYYAGPFPFPQRILRMTIPVRDHHDFALARIIVAFSDNYFMSLMFFISGLFVTRTLRRVGARQFVVARARRLGLPFLLSSVAIAGVAYYAAYTEFTPAGNVADYLRTWQTPGGWMSGPAWFVAVLLVFDLFAAALYLAPPLAGDVGMRLAASAEQRPLRFVAVVVAISAAAYVPMALILGPFSWWNFGPFWVQESRALHYAIYFGLGVIVGGYGLRRGLTAAHGRLARHARGWALAALLGFVAVGNLQLAALRAPHSFGAGLIADLGWVLGCALSCFASLALAIRFARPNAILESLSRNAYGMYLVHYAPVTWTQFALLQAPLPAPVKALIVIAVAIGASWAIAAGLRRIPGVARTI